MEPTHNPAEMESPGAANSRGSSVQPNWKHQEYVTDQSCQGTKDWYGTDHPYYELGELLEEGLWLLESRQRKAAMESLQHTKVLLSRFESQTQTPGRLAGIKTAIEKATHVPKKNAEDVLETARRSLARMIVADEDTKFPGCRTEEGEFLEDKAREMEEGVTR